MSGEYSKILVTGGSGFVGRKLLDNLVDRTPFDALYIAVRHASKESGVLNNKISFLNFNLSSSINFETPVDLVLHVAGEKKCENQMWEVNVEGTRRLLDWSAEHGVKRFVYLSSVGVYGARKNAGIVVEKTAKFPANTYEFTKSAAEDLVRQKCRQHGIEYVILQPSNVIGWSDGKAYPLLGLMKMIQRGWFIYFGKVDTCFNYVAVEDVASAIVDAIAPSAADQTFIINTPVPMKIFVRWIADELGVVPPTRRVPALVGRTIAALADVLGILTGKSIPFGKARYTELTNTTCFDGSFVCDVLGDVYSLGIELAVRQLVRRYREEGLI